MVVREIIDRLDGMARAYDSEDFDITKWHSLPLLIIEDSGNTYVSDPVILERVFGGVAYCKECLGLPKIDYHLQHLQVVSDTICITTVIWDFFNAQKGVELTLEIGYVFQKKDSVWKVIVILQPIWRDPTKSRVDITKNVGNQPKNR